MICLTFVTTYWLFWRFFDDVLWLFFSNFTWRLPWSMFIKEILFNSLRNIWNLRQVTWGGNILNFDTKTSVLLPKQWLHQTHFTEKLQDDIKTSTMASLFKENCLFHYISFHAGNKCVSSVPAGTRRGLSCCSSLSSRCTRPCLLQRRSEEPAATASTETPSTRWTGA